MDKSKVRKALEDTPEPTPGYLYNEFAQWTFKDVSTQADLVNYLFDRLQRSHTSAFVLYKALHIVKLLCEMAHPDFQREVQRTPRAEVIRQLTTYRGMLDAKFGDAWNEKVRQEAREALVNIFTDFSAHQNQQKQQQQQQQQQQAGSSDWKGSGFAGGNTNDTMTFGQSDSSFRTGMAVGTSYTSPSSSSTAAAGGAYVGSGGGGGVATYAGMESHIGEMPRENKWAEHVARLQNDPNYASQCRSGGTAADGFGGAGSSSSSSFMTQLSRTAKAGWHTIAQHDALIMNSQVPSVRAGASSYESNYTRRMHMADAGPSTQGQASGFEPVSLGPAPGAHDISDDNDYGSVAGGKTGDEDVRLAGSGVGRWGQQQQQEQITSAPTSAAVVGFSASGKSGFDFLNRSASPPQQQQQQPGSGSSSPSPAPSSSQTRAASMESSVASLVQRYVIAPQQTPQRVELAEFTSQAVQLAVRATELSGRPSQSSAMLETVFADEAGPSSDVGSSSSSSNAEKAVWKCLAQSLFDQLDITQRTWRVRLNVLTCLEALLKASPISVSAFLDTTDSGTASSLSISRVTTSLAMGQTTLRGFFTTETSEFGTESPANRVRENAAVVQATLKERATKVLGLLGLSLTPPPQAQAQSSPPPLPAPNSHAQPVPTAGPNASGDRTASATNALDDLFGPSSPSSVAVAGTAAATTTSVTPSFSSPGPNLFDGVQLTRRRAAKSAEQQTQPSPLHSPPPAASSSAAPRITILSTTRMSTAMEPTHETPRADGSDDVNEVEEGVRRPRRSQSLQVVDLASDPIVKTGSGSGGDGSTAPTRGGGGVQLDDLFSTELSPRAPPGAAPPSSQQQQQTQDVAWRESTPPTAATDAPSANLLALREAQASLEELLGSLQRRQLLGGTEAPSADELAHAQALLTEQRQILRSYHPPQHTATASPSEPARAGARHDAPVKVDDVEALLFNQPATATTTTTTTTSAAWQSAAQPVQGQNANVDAALGGGTAMDNHSHFQMGGSSKLSPAQIANTRLAAVQAEMLSKYTQ